tara:strand:+ start:339 stop:833 length:495 start_codon:yes stop_codon:yes gene_type:complete
VSEIYVQIKTVNDLKGVFAKREGAKWIVKYIEEFGYTFANRKLQFESRVTNVDGTDIRIMDILDVTDRFAPIYYELKSVNKVPPYDFNTQFIKDLSRDNVGDLSQIQWIFDGAKSPPDFKSNLLNVVDDLSFSANVLIKFGFTRNAQLRELISDNFEDVFVLVE